MFSERDFDAYLPHKWGDNVFNLERLRVKDKLAGLRRRLTAADGRFLGTLQSGISPEAPSLWNGRKVDAQWLFFFRSREQEDRLLPYMQAHTGLSAGIAEASPASRHLNLALVVDAGGIDIGLRLHRKAWPDRENLVRKVEYIQHRETLLGMLHGLDEGFEVGSAAALPARSVTSESLDGLLAGGGPDGWLRIARRLPRTDPLATGDDLAQTAGRLLAGLEQLYRFCLWLPENDLVGLTGEISRRKEEGLDQLRKSLRPGTVIRVRTGAFAGKTGTITEISRSGRLTVRIGLFQQHMDVEDVEKA